MTIKAKKMKGGSSEVMGVTDAASYGTSVYGTSSQQSDYISSQSTGAANPQAGTLPYAQFKGGAGKKYGSKRNANKLKGGGLGNRSAGRGAKMLKGGGLGNHGAGKDDTMLKGGAGKDDDKDDKMFKGGANGKDDKGAGKDDKGINGNEMIKGGAGVDIAVPLVLLYANNAYKPKHASVSFRNKKNNSKSRFSRRANKSKRNRKGKKH